MKTIGERLKVLIGLWLPERKRFTTLEKISGIPSDHWKNFWHGRQRAHEHMIQAVARQWPEHALWLTTGIDDPEFGQTIPGKVLGATRSKSGEMLRRKIQLNETITLMSTLNQVDIAKEAEQKPEQHPELVAKIAEELLQLHKLAELHQMPIEKKDLDGLQVKLEQRVYENDEELKKLRAMRLTELRTDGAE